MYIYTYDIWHCKMCEVIISLYIIVSNSKLCICITNTINISNT